MATAIEIITKSMRLVKAIGTGEALTGTEATDALAALNSMMDYWAVQRLLIYRITRTTKALTIGDANYTVASGADISIARPVRLENSNYITDGNIDYPVQLINEQAYRMISTKTVSGLPAQIFYDPKYPTAEINLWPVPDKAYTLNLATWVPLQSFASLTDDLALPPGYQMMIEYNLATYLALEYGVSIPPEVRQIAGETMARVKRINAPKYVMHPESALLTTVVSGDINTIYG